MNTIIIILIIISAISKSLLDLSSENTFTKKWWNKSSWRNKYIISEKFSNKFGLKKLFYFLFTKPLVFLTDGWHLFQFFTFNPLILSISLLILTNNSNLTFLNLIFSFAILKLIHSLIFNTIYDYGKARNIRT